MSQLGDLVLAGMNKEQVERHLRPFLVAPKRVEKKVLPEVKKETPKIVPVARVSPGVKSQVVKAPSPVLVSKPAPVVVQQPAPVVDVVEPPVVDVKEIDESLPELEQDNI